MAVGAGRPLRPDIAAARAYDVSAPGWASGAELVYGPLARALVDTSPDPWPDRLVLDAGAGTGAATRALLDAGARVVATDFSAGMLRHDAANRPAAAVADVLHLPLRAATVDAAAAAFLLNHLEDPVAALRELGRVVRSGGVILASSFSNIDRFPAKDAIDGVLARHGWTPPDWYLDIKKRTAPPTGTADGLAGFARDAGLEIVEATERDVDVGPLTAAQLVAYRFGQAHTQAFLGTLTERHRESITDEAIARLDGTHSSLPVATVFLVAYRV